MTIEINQNRIYQEYLEWITPQKSDVSVKNELSFIGRNANIYRTLVDPRGDSHLANFGRFCVAFDITIAFPLIMAVFDDEQHGDEEKAELLRDFESYMIRRSVCGRTAKGYNKIFLQAIKELRTKNFGPQALRKFLSGLKGDSNDWPEDAEFERHFHSRPLYKELPASRLVYILRKLENAERSKFSEDITVNSNLSIEHVMPQGWMETWPLASGKFPNSEQIDWAKRQAMLGLPLDALSGEIVRRQSVIDTLGNLTLIVGSLNLSVGNGPFSKKRDAILQYSALRLNRYFHSVAEWDERTVKLRSEALFETARHLWARP